MATTKSSKDCRVGYQLTLVGLLSLNFGIVFFDRNALGFLMPFVQPELGLSNTEVGMLVSGLALTWALAAFGIGFVSDRTGSRKGLLIAATLLFSVCSFLSGIAGSFVALVAARLLMGIAEGGIMPISQALITSEVEPRQRGLAMGVAQNFGSNLFGGFVAPVVLVSFAASFGWRHAFFLAGAPGLVSTFLIWRYIRDVPRLTPNSPGAEAGRQRRLLVALKDRNVAICAVIAILLVSDLLICMAFMPLYLTQVRRLDASTMGWLMGTLGLSATVGSFAISALSDWIGRRPVMVATPLIGTILPLGAMYFDGSMGVLAAIFFVGWGLNGIFPLFMATVPSESVDARDAATAIGICMGTGEMVGGTLAPFIAGYAADTCGLQAPLWIMFSLTIVAGLLALMLRETAPRVLVRAAASQRAVPG